MNIDNRLEGNDESTGIRYETCGVKSMIAMLLYKLNKTTIYNNRHNNILILPVSSWNVTTVLWP